MTILEIAFVMDRSSLRGLGAIPGHLNGKKVVHHPYSTIAFKDDIQSRHVRSIGQTMCIDCKDIMTSKDATVLLFDPLPESTVSPQYMVLMAAPGVSVDNYKLDLCSMESISSMRFTLSPRFTLSGKIGARVAREGQNPEWVFDLDELYRRDDFFNVGVDFGRIGRIVSTLIAPNTPIAEMALSPVAGIADADDAETTADTIVRRELASFQPASDLSVATEYMRAAARSLEILRQHEACEQCDPQEPYRTHDTVYAAADSGVSVSAPNGLPDMPRGYPASPQVCGPSTDGDCELEDAGCCDECCSCESCGCDGSGS